MKKKPGLWIIGYFILVLAVLVPIGYLTVRVDPFFHYHMPDTAAYYYKLDNQRSQNDGIIRQFYYTGMITGTSMTENFKTSEAEELWGGSFIKVPFSGGSFKEINENIETALQRNSALRVVIRGMETVKLGNDKDAMREDLGEYPTYLYDDNLLNDVEYIFNRDVVFTRVYDMTKANDEPDFEPGITSFDNYSNWSDRYLYGKNTLFPDGVNMKTPQPWSYRMTETLERMTRENVRQNVTDLADAYPDIEFYYFFTPYSAQFWMQQVENGTLERLIDTERVAIEEILQHPNIRLYSFNCLFDLTTDLNNYKDYIHYGEWVNSMILRYMYEGKCRLTQENYEAYLAEEKEFYSTYDYNLLNGQEDYMPDSYAAFLLAEKTGGYTGEVVDLSDPSLQLRHAEVVEDQYDGGKGILCTGALPRDYLDTDGVLSDYLWNTDYIGFRLDIDDMTPYSFIAFYGRKLEDHGQPTVYIYDEEGNVLDECWAVYRDLDSEWRMYAFNVSALEGPASVIFQGGYIDNSGSPWSQFVFSRVLLY